MKEQQAKDRLLLALLPDVAFDGWSLTALRSGARCLGMPEAEAASMFHGRATEMVDWFAYWADRRMLAELPAALKEGMRTRERVAEAVMTRLTALARHREAERRALAVLAMPQNSLLALRILFRTVDTIWYAAGDTATDFNYYTKRALLAAAYAATVLYWLEDSSPGHRDTRAFLDRRLADIMAIPQTTQRLRQVMDRLPNPFRALQAMERR